MSSNVTTHNSEVFEPFSRLPIELRCKIIQLACHEPRVVEVRFAKPARGRYHDFVGSVPPLLHATKETRAEAIKYYQSSFVNHKALDKMVWFNANVDVLYFRETLEEEQIYAAFDRLPGKDIIRRIAISSNSARNRMTLNFFGGRWGDDTEIKPRILQFTALEEVLVLKHLSQLEVQCRQCFPTHQAPKNRTLLVDESKVQKHQLHLGLDEAELCSVLDQLRLEKEVVARFLDGMERKKWTFKKWKEPVFTYGGFSSNAITHGNIYCLPEGFKTHATRSRKRL